VHALGAEPSKDTIKIGFMLPLTGLEANEAKLFKPAFDLAVKQINAAGGINGQKVEAVIEDTKSTPQAALIAYEKLIDQSKVSGVVAPMKSAQIIALIPKMLKSGVPTFIGGTNPRLTFDGKWFFRTRPDDSITTMAVVQYIKDSLHFTKIGILHDNGAFGSGGANLIEKNAKAYGLTVVKRLGYNLGEKDFAPAIKALKEAGTEVMVVYFAGFTESATIEKEYAKAGRPFVYLGSPGSQSKVAIEQAKEASEGIYAAVDFVFGQTDVDKKYLADFRAEYKEEPDQIATYAYDGVKILANAMTVVGQDKGKIREHILGIKNYQGVQGHYAFTPNGDGLHSVSIVKIVGGKPQLVKVVDVVETK
jgi:branched-chain amino acid transport system substrate-binding protein